MKDHSKNWLACLLFTAVSACNNQSTPAQQDAATPQKDSLARGSYGYDLGFLKKHTEGIVELSDGMGAKILLSADYQGRVMTSTSAGDSGKSFGWLNYDLISALVKRKQFNPVGGEERFWIGPEGGQFAFYFPPNDSFSIASWQVPALVDTISYHVAQPDPTHAVFSQSGQLTNYSGSVFNIQIDREIALLPKAALEQELKISIPEGVSSVGYRTSNSVTNTGRNDWKKSTGLLSIWLLGMFTPTPQTVVIIPFHPQANARSLITDNYFGTVAPERLQVKDSVLYFTCDGLSRGKIGLSPLIAKPVAAGFDFKNNVLTLVIPTIDRQGMYVNSKWEKQKEPYKGDVINAYNDGPLADGSQLGPFFEIESSSSVKEMKSGDALHYSQVTCHLQGDYSALRGIAQQLLHVDLDEIKR
ncbi:MAG TPA: DUF6786 family protein [Chitinophagaceae bacterium]|nr:DUF6786 family protein [Chitinophagaceae bacterium]